MRINSKLFSIVFVASTFPLISAGTAQASEMCTVKTAKQSVSSNTLCACEVVSSRMIKYIQRRADFESVLEQTLLDCPAFASLLTDLPTASLGLADRRSGDGLDDENPRGGNEPDGDRTSDGDNSPKGGDKPTGGDDPEVQDDDPDEKSDEDRELARKAAEDGLRAELREKEHLAHNYREAAKEAAAEGDRLEEAGDLKRAEEERDRAWSKRELARYLSEEAERLRGELGASASGSDWEREDEFSR